MNTNTASILVVEDEALIADDLERTLSRMGYRIPAVVAEGDRAIAAAVNNHPSLVLMDIKLRGPIDGIEAARTIRDRCEVPIVFLTSHSDSATLSRASAARPQGYVMKPFVERDLRVAIELALHKHEVEQTLRTKEQWFSTTLRCLGEGVIATDEKLTVTYMNRAAEAITGWTHDEAVGRPSDEVLCLVDRDGAAVPGPAAQALASRNVTHLPAATRLRQRSASYAVVDDSAAPIIDPSGRVLGAVVVFRDVTAKRDLEARVARSERLVSLGTMAAGLCHEINNPLTSLLANLEVSLEELAGPVPVDELRESLEDAREAGKRIANIITGMRAFAQPRDDDGEGANLPDVIDASLKLTAHILRQHGTVERDFRAAPVVQADHGRLTQVFVNLLANAGQAIPPGDAANHRIKVSLYTDASGYGVVEVTDDGCGIAPEHLARVFDPFFTTKAPGNGMGLGLSICAGIIEGFGGEISVRSTVGVGTTFTVRLPPRKDRGTALLGAAQARGTAQERAPYRGRVLVVDDERGVTRALTRALSGRHDVVTCDDGCTALARLQAGEVYDLVLCDLVMPNLTGMEVYQSVFAQRPAQAARFVFHTGGTQSDANRAAVERAGIPVLRKPFLDIFSLRDTVSDLIAHWGAPPKDEEN